MCNRQGKWNVATGFVLVLLLALALGSLGLARQVAAGGFIENRGQEDDQVLYYMSGERASVFFTHDKVVIDIREIREGSRAYDRKRPSGPSILDDAPEPPGSGCVIHVHFENANPLAAVQSRHELEGRYNYFRGSDRSKWLTDVPAHAEVVYQDLWPGVDIVYRLEGADLVYEIKARAGAEIPQDLFRYEGAQEVIVDGDGTRIIRTSVGDLADLRSAEETLGRLSFIEGRMGEGGGFPVLGDDPSKLVWSTFLGSTWGDEAWAIEVDSSDNTVAVGWSWNADFPTTAGAYDQIHNGQWDCIVFKLDSTGSTLLWSTFVGGSVDDDTWNLELDSSENVVVTGHTYSADFPTTAGAYDQTFNGEIDAYVFKLSSSGNALLWSSFIGGWWVEYGTSVALDPVSDAPVIHVYTVSDDYPTTAGAWDETYNCASGYWDVAVTKFAADGSALLWSTFIGGTYAQGARDVLLDDSGNPVVTGYVYSTDFPTTSGAYDRIHDATYCDAYVTKLTADGSGLVWSTFLGGHDSYDSGSELLDCGSSGIIAIGPTESPDFPTTSRAYDTTHNGFDDVFVTKLNASGTALVWSTFVGGSDNEYAGNNPSMDAYGNIVFAAYTYSTDYPTTPDAYQQALKVTREPTVSVLDPFGRLLPWSSYIGGNTDDLAFGMTLDSSGDVVITGSTNSPDYPTTVGSYDPTFNGPYDCFVSKLDLPDAPPANIICEPAPRYLTETVPVNTVDVEYLGLGGGPIYGYSMSVSWDGAVASLTGVTEGTLLSNQGSTHFSYNTVGNTCYIDCVLLGAYPGVSDPGTMFTLEFTGVAFGTSLVDLTVIKVRDSVNNPLTGFIDDDGELVVDLNPPVVTNVFIENTTLAHTDDYIKNGDNATVTADVSDDDPAFGLTNITADLTGLGGGPAVNPDTYAGGVATWNLAGVTCTPSDGTVTVTVTATDPIGNTASDSDDIIADNTPPVAVADLSAVQVKSGNDSDGTTEITLTFTAPGDAYATEVYNAGFGDYPEYDDGTGAEPAAPSYPPAAPWALTAVTTSGETDEPAARDFWYYVVFTKDIALNISAVSNKTAGTLNYHLGDVSDGATPGQGDNYINTVDISLLSGSYFVGHGHPSYLNYCDVGPTTDLSTDALPTTDDFVDFEDLMMFALNFTTVSFAASDDIPVDRAVGTPSLALRIQSGEGQEYSDLVVARLVLKGNRSFVKGLHAEVSYDAAAMELIDVSAGSLLEEQGAPVFSKHREESGTVEFDAAALGRNIAISGSGEVAELRFRLVGTVSDLPELRVASLRDRRNRPVGVAVEPGVAGEVSPSEAAPTTLSLSASPNPFSESTTLRLTLPSASVVKLSIYDVSGRLVQTLGDSQLSAGEHRFEWDGRTSSGTLVAPGAYIAVMNGGGKRLTQKLFVLP
jgi:hypothetical protein